MMRNLEIMSVPELETLMRQTNSLAGCKRIQDELDRRGAGLSRNAQDTAPLFPTSNIEHRTSNIE